MTSSHRPPAQRASQIICSSCPLLMAVFYTPTRDHPGAVQAMCSETQEGRTLVTFLSPMDGYLEAAYSSRYPERVYQVVPLASFDPRSLMAHNGGRLVIHCTIGFAASDGRLITDANGRLCGYGLVESITIAPDATLPWHLELDPDIGKNFERMHELAGLSAWQDTLAASWKWDEKKRLQELAAAMAAIPGRAPSDAPLNQVALYDPEFRQWHFVNEADLDVIPA